MGLRFPFKLASSFIECIMSKKYVLAQGTWQEWWPIIYEAVEKNKKPDTCKLHSNFWGYRRESGCYIPNDPFHDRILSAGPSPRLMNIENAIGLGGANLTSWLRRRVCYIKNIPTDPH